MHTFGILFSVHLHLHHPYIHKYKNHFNEMKGDVGMADQQETRHGLESNPVPTTSFFNFIAPHCSSGGQNRM